MWDPYIDPAITIRLISLTLTYKRKVFNTNVQYADLYEVAAHYN